jgi:phage terminase large subunit GpA-like protein
MFATAEWRATAPSVRGIRGYRCWAVVSPWLRLSELVRGFLVAKKQPDTLQTWVNLTRGESWEMPSERVDSAALLTRREQYIEDVPEKAVLLTCGIDTQDDRLELLVVGWGPGEESWVIARETIPGDPVSADVWSELDVYLLRQWSREGGGYARIQFGLVDALGHRTAAVYSAVLTRQARRIGVLGGGRLYASFGKDGGAAGQIVAKPKALATRQGNVLACVVDASQVKERVHARLRIADAAGPGVIHFPMDVGDAFFTELTAEHQITERNRYGVPSKKWAMRPGHRRNESLDCFGLALAAYHLLCPTERKFQGWARLLESSRHESTDPTDPTAQVQAPQATKTISSRRLTRSPNLG